MKRKHVTIFSLLAIALALALTSTASQAQGTGGTGFSYSINATTSRKLSWVYYDADGYPAGYGRIEMRGCTGSTYSVMYYNNFLDGNGWFFQPGVIYASDLPKEETFSEPQFYDGGECILGVRSYKTTPENLLKSQLREIFLPTYFGGAGVMFDSGGAGAPARGGNPYP